MTRTDAPGTGWPAASSTMPFTEPRPSRTMSATICSPAVRTNSSRLRRVAGHRIADGQLERAAALVLVHVAELVAAVRARDDVGHLACAGPSGRNSR